MKFLQALVLIGLMPVAFVGCGGGAPNVLGQSKNRFGKSVVCPDDYKPFDLKKEEKRVKRTKSTELSQGEYKLEFAQVYAELPPRDGNQKPVQIHLYEGVEQEKRKSGEQQAPAKPKKREMKIETLCVSGFIPDDEFEANVLGIDSLNVTEEGMEANTFSYQMRFSDNLLKLDRGPIEVQQKPSFSGLFPDAKEVYFFQVNPDAEARKKAKARNKPLPRRYEIRLKGQLEDGTPYQLLMRFKQVLR